MRSDRALSICLRVQPVPVWDRLLWPRSSSTRAVSFGAAWRSAELSRVCAWRRGHDEGMRCNQMLDWELEGRSGRDGRSIVVSMLSSMSIVQQLSRSAALPAIATNECRRELSVDYLMHRIRDPDRLGAEGPETPCAFQVAGGEAADPARSARRSAGADPRRRRLCAQRPLCVGCQSLVHSSSPPLHSCLPLLLSSPSKR